MGRGKEGEGEDAKKGAKVENGLEVIWGERGGKKRDKGRDKCEGTKGESRGVARGEKRKESTCETGEGDKAERAR